MAATQISLSPIATSKELDSCYSVPTDDEESLDDVDIPDAFLCPLTLELMVDPLVNRYGQTYERAAILEWLNRGNTVCPMTKQPLTASGLIPNERLRAQIVGWKIAHGQHDLRDLVKERDFTFRGVLVLPDSAPSGEAPVPVPVQAAVSTSQPQHRPRNRRGVLSRLRRPFRSSGSQ